MFITPLDVEEKYTAGEYFYSYKGNEINIVFRSIEKLRELSTTEEKDKFQKEVFRNAEVIWQKDNEVKDLIEKIKN